MVNAVQFHLPYAFRQDSSRATRFACTGVSHSTPPDLQQLYLNSEELGAISPEQRLLSRPFRRLLLRRRCPCRAFHPASWPTLTSVGILAPESHSIARIYHIWLCAEAPGGPGTDQTATGTKLASGTTQHSSHHHGQSKHPSCTQDHEHTAACGLATHEHVSPQPRNHCFVPLVVCTLPLILLLCCMALAKFL